jgi:hypothetical protein
LVLDNRNKGTDYYINSDSCVLCVKERGREGGRGKGGREGKGSKVKGRKGKERRKKGRKEGRKKRRKEGRKEEQMGGSYSSCITSLTPVKKLRTKNLQPGYKNHFVNMLQCGICFSK